LAKQNVDGVFGPDPNLITSLQIIFIISPRKTLI
jgi:hypothetical protein